MRNHLARALIGFALAAAAWGQSVLTVEARDALTGAPLADTTVRIEGGVTSTGSDGLAHFAPLAAGTYRVTCERTGYVTSDAVMVRLGEAGERVSIRLTPHGSVEGVVTDEEGLPMAGVLVYTRQPGFGPKQRAATDREGRFRADALAPGDYVLLFRVPSEVRKATLKRNPEAGETYGYPAVWYYPGSAQADAAVPIRASPGAALTGFDIRLRRVLLVEFSGRLVDRVTRQSLPKARLFLIEPESPFMENSSHTESNGAFRFELIQPGPYELSWFSGGPAPATIPVSIGKGGIAGMVVMPPVAQRIAGRVVPLPEGETWIGVVSLRLQGNGVGWPFEVRKDGEFVIENVPPGEWRVEATTNARRERDQKRLAVAAVGFGAQDAMAQRIAIAESGNSMLEVTLTADTGRIAGVVDLDGAPKVNSVFLRRRGHASLEMEKIKQDGTFVFEALAPGVYEVAARADAQLASGVVTRVEVTAGETAVVRLRAILDR